MYKIQLLLPLYNKEGHLFSAQLYQEIKTELSQTFGGLTAYTRAPAEGLWKEEDDKIVRDGIYIYEVMASQLDKHYWAKYKLKMQKVFQQDEIIIRGSSITLL